MDKNKETIRTPDFNYNRITDISPAAIRRMGARAIAVDIDNTILPYGSYTVDDKIKRWADTIQKAGIPIVIVSNTVIGRAYIISRQLGNVPFIPLALKPSTHGLRIASKILGIPVEDIAMVGDKVSTDILSANKAGAVSVKLDPIRELPSINIKLPVPAAISALFTIK